MTTALVTIMAAGVSHGCCRSEWERKKAERLSRIDTTACRFGKHDAEGWERVHNTHDQIARARCYHKEHLEKTTGLVRREWNEDKRKWCEEHEKRHEFIRKQWHGRPHTLCGTWAKMVY